MDRKGVQVVTCHGRHPDEAATYQKAQTVLHTALGQSELDKWLAARDAVHIRLLAILDAEIKHVDLPQTRQQAMARQTEAECDRAYPDLLKYSAFPTCDLTLELVDDYYRWRAHQPVEIAAPEPQAI